MGMEESRRSRWLEEYENNKNCSDIVVELFII